MKKFLYFILSLVLVFFAPISPLENASAETVTRGVILFTTTQEENEITITVSMKDNKGLSSLLLTLDYNSSIFKFKEYKKGEALSEEMNLIATDTENGDGYDTIPFKFHWQSQSKNNDCSNGVILTLKFEVLEDVKDGTYPITLKYDQKSDVCYYGNGNLKQGAVVIDKANVTIGDGKIEITIINGDETGNILLIIILISFAIVAVVGCIVALIIVRKNKKKGWQKIK